MSSWVLVIVVTLLSTALDTEDEFRLLLIRPLGRLNEPVDRALMVRLRRSLPWVAPRAFPTSARLTAR